MSHADLLAFYQRHYHPGNAILAVVGDVNTENIIQQVQDHFGALPARAPTPAPHTIEPAQTGERRLILQGEVERKHFKMYARNSIRFPAFYAH
jgi:zinc protease